MVAIETKMCIEENTGKISFESKVLAYTKDDKQSFADKLVFEKNIFVYCSSFYASVSSMKGLISSISCPQSSL